MCEVCISLLCTEVFRQIQQFCGCGQARQIVYHKITLFNC